MTISQLSIALGEYDTGWHDPAGSLASAAQLVRRAAESGARVVVLPEMATSGFTMDRTQAVALGSSDVDSLRSMARAHSVWIIAGVALRDDGESGRATNAALAIDPKGEIIAIHRKRRLFAYADEEKTYAAGDRSTLVTIDGVRIALFICYELRSPEVFGEVAEDADAMVVIANWPASRQTHWDALLHARAIENQCFVIGVNRVGRANGLDYSGGSVVFDPWGERLTPKPDADVRIVAIDASRTQAIREAYPFLRDRRPSEAR